MSAPTNKLRIVVDFTGGVVHAVYAGQPVEVIFVSSDKEDIDDEYQEEMGFVDPQGKRVALLVRESEAGDNSGVVEHFFAQQQKS
jgi:hypothetical protein